MKVCHMTSAHPPEDVRIFHKECVSLAKAGFEVYLVECGESCIKKGVHIVGLGEKPRSRKARMTGFARTVYEKALELDCDVYHFHDPELLPYGLKLEHRGKKVIFDTHKDVPGQIMDKTWIRKPLRKMVSGLYRSYETHVVKQLDAVVASTPHITEKFRGRAKRVVNINNFPKLDDIVFHETPFADREALVCYAGGISEDRGESIMKNALREVDGQLIIAGDHAVEEQANVRYIGKLDRAGVNELYGRAVLGLCILKPTENYYYSQPIKMYEYMAAGIPFVCSDFPGWRRVAEASGGGVCVDPADLDAIRRAITELLQDRDRAQEMGRQGHDYVIANCTWENEGKKLVELYRCI